MTDGPVRKKCKWRAIALARISPLRFSSPFIRRPGALLPSPIVHRPRTPTRAGLGPPPSDRVFILATRHVAMLRSAARRLGAAAAARSSPVPSPASARRLVTRDAARALVSRHASGAAGASPPLGTVRHDWTTEEVEALYNRPLLELVYDAATVHRMHHDPSQVQQCTLLSIKTGGCPETCNYCAQSSSWKDDTGLKAEKLMGNEDVIAAARRAKEAGSTRFCMGTAWRGPSQVGKGQFERVLAMTREVRDMGMEVCATLGMLNHEQARQLREAGLTAYNHNLDTSPEFYPKVTTSRNYEDRLNTIAAVREAGISVCCGGILGLGEEERDRASLLRVLANLPEHPESVPINALVPVKGTPLEHLEPPGGLEMVRAIAVARLVMPKTVVRLSAGRVNMSASDQAMCFLAGANSVFTGDKLLTTPNNEASEDDELMAELGLVGRPAFTPYLAGGKSSDGSEFPDVAPSIKEGAERARAATA